MLRIIATKRPITFNSNLFKEGIGIDAFSKNTADLSELIKELILIPANERTDTFIAYEVIAK